MGSSRVRRLDTAHFKSGAAGFIEKEAVGATDLEQAALWLAVLDELDRAGELAPQHGFGAAIVGVAVGLTAGKVAIVIISKGIEARCLGASQSAVSTLKDVASVLKKPMRRLPTARWTLERKRSSVVSHQHMRPPMVFLECGKRLLCRTVPLGKRPGGRRLACSQLRNRSRMVHTLAGAAR